MLDRRLWPNFILFFLGLIVCLSIWQMSIIGPNPLPPIYSQINHLLPYVLNNANTTYVYPKHYLPPSDYVTVMNLTDFHFNFLTSCTFSPILLVLIHTTPEHFRLRMTIRETWGRERDGLKIVFILGKVKDLRLQKELNSEYEKYRDLVQGSFFDTYRNLTYKHVSSLKYVIYHCPQAKYILKTDDDVFVNMRVMIHFLKEELSPYGAKKLLLCTPLVNSPVKRSFRSKWRVAFHEYKDKFYPSYCPGWALLYSPDVLFALYRAVQKANYFWIDDVLITGILAKKENIQHTNAESLVLSRDNLDAIHTYGGSFYNRSRPFLYGPPNLGINDIHLLSDLVKNDTKFSSLFNRDGR